MNYDDEDDSESEDDDLRADSRAYNILWTD